MRERSDGKVLDLHLTVNTGEEHELLEKMAFKILGSFSTLPPKE